MPAFFSGSGKQLYSGLGREHLFNVFCRLIRFFAVLFPMAVDELPDVSRAPRLRDFSSLEGQAQLAIGQRVPSGIVNHLVPHKD